MALTKCKLGELIERLDNKNADLKYGVEYAVGVSNDKLLMSTRADLNGRDLTKFSIIHPGDFVYNHRTSRHGGKFCIAYNTTSDNVICTEDYTLFRIRDDCKNKLLNEWLYMYFHRPEMDRFVMYSSWGSSTEFFNWDDVCDIDIELPDLPTQQKYVDIYNAMVANQQSYERGLEDLKLTFDALLDNIKHNASMVPMRDLLAEVDNRNSTGEIVDVQGINIFKQFMPSVADTNGVDLTKYKIVRKGQFVYSGMQTGRDECIRIALFDKDEPIIISPAYTVFEIKDGAVLLEYIMMWFSRKESDRRGWFMSDSSIRTNLDLERFYEIGIPLPDEKMQRSVVDLYKVYTLRRSINEQLKAQIKDICPILIRGALEEGT
ncbi:MAG: restriction endonuclease subunit S [Clostridia bacterium]|nr:restriction endonuclease subunit S [Clostridia bacterium]